MSVSKHVYIGPYFECPYTKGLPDRYDVVEDALHSVGETALGNRSLLYLVPNVRRDGDPRRKWDNDGEVHLDLKDLSPAHEMAWLRVAFAEEMLKLQVAYGAVEIKWGLHQYYM